MIPTRSVPGSTSNMRKSRLDGRPSSLLPRHRPGSIEQLSSETRRPTVTGLRSSSVEHPRATVASGRLSREASVSKIPRSRASRSHQGERFGQSSMTPLRSSQYQIRATATPSTPSEDRLNRNWKASLERALAFVTVKDQRPLSNAAWQRATLMRVQAALAARGVDGDGGGAALVRPLTIARFIDVVLSLLHVIYKDVKLNSENYITKLPHLSKRLLYPGQVSKSWLRTVNTLHAFPHALALIAYLLDLVERIESPVSDEWLYVAKDELSCLRRDYLYKCWLRFQHPDHQFEDLSEQYLKDLEALLGNDEEKMAKLQESIKKLELCLEDETEVAARAEEARLLERRDALQAALRAQRSARLANRAAAAAATAACSDKATELDALTTDIERLNIENQQLKLALEQQPMSMLERARLLDQVDYDNRVYSSKCTLAEQIAKTVTCKESEVTLWQTKTLERCAQYQELLICLSGRLPELNAHAIDEKELMDNTCAERLYAAVAHLRSTAAALVERRAEAVRERGARVHQRQVKQQETRDLIKQNKEKIERAQQALEAELEKETTEVTAWTAEERKITDRMEELRVKKEEYAKADAELEFWEQQDAQWRAHLSEMREYISLQKKEMPRILESACAKRVQLVADAIKQWNDKLK